jgi:hypothetical protein
MRGYIRPLAVYMDKLVALAKQSFCRPQFLTEVFSNSVVPGKFSGG